MAAESTPEGMAAVHLVSRLDLDVADEVIAVAATTPAVPVSVGSSVFSGTSGLMLVGWGGENGGDALSASAEATLGALPCATRVVQGEGPVTRAMRDTIDRVDPDLVVVPDVPPRSRLEAFLFGDPWAALLGRTTVPVLLARPDAAVQEPAGPGTTRGLTVLVAVDEPTTGGDALRALLRLPLPTGTQVVVLALVPSSGDPAAASVRGRMVRRTDAAVRMLRDAGMHAARLVLGGDDPTAAILETAGSYAADLVVIGAVRDPIRERLVGPARTIARRAPAAVMVVPAGLPRRAHRWRGMSGARGPGRLERDGRRSVDGSLGI